ncbi:MAG: D-Ala-D-Ala carboxypeptidase family metallohydrolase [Candidatus Anstonellales archaeon]
MQLTKNFFLHEFITSPTALRIGINNYPDEKAVKNLKRLYEKVLQPVRDHFQKPVVITSGYRSSLLNKHVGGVPNSQHTTGEAADFYIPGVDNLKVANWIKDNLTFDQLILEYYQGGNSGWIHVSYSDNNRKQVLTITYSGRYYGLRGA